MAMRVPAVRAARKALLLVAAFIPGRAAAMRLGQLRPTLTPRPTLGQRCTKITALYEGDPWLTSTERSPLSGASLDALFRYGPVVYAARCGDAEEYNASVRNLMSRYPKISRALAEQEINKFLSEGNAYMAAQTAERKKSGPKEEELLPPVDLADKLLVVVWVAILSVATYFIGSLSMSTPPPPRPDSAVVQTADLLSLPKDALQDLQE